MIDQEKLNQARNNLNKLRSDHPSYILYGPHSYQIEKLAELRESYEFLLSLVPYQGDEEPVTCDPEIGEIPG